ncbi:hypothetical protein ABZ741_40740 [Streptomyces globisporus]
MGDAPPRDDDQHVDTRVRDCAGNGPGYRPVAHQLGWLEARGLI